MWADLPRSVRREGGRRSPGLVSLPRSRGEREAGQSGAAISRMDVLSQRASVHSTLRERGSTSDVLVKE